MTYIEKSSFFGEAFFISDNEDSPLNSTSDYFNPKKKKVLKWLICVLIQFKGKIKIIIRLLATFAAWISQIWGGGGITKSHLITFYNYLTFSLGV